MYTDAADLVHAEAHVDPRHRQHCVSFMNPGKICLDTIDAFVLLVKAGFEELLLLRQWLAPLPRAADNVCRECSINVYKAIGSRILFWGENAARRAAMQG